MNNEEHDEHIFESVLESILESESEPILESVLESEPVVESDIMNIEETNVEETNIDNEFSEFNETNCTLVCGGEHQKIGRTHVNMSQRNRLNYGHHGNEVLRLCGGRSKGNSGGKKFQGKTIRGKRHKLLERNILGITKPAIRRLARRGGIKRLSSHIYENHRGKIKSFMKDVIRDTLIYTDHARRKTVTAQDVVYALKKQNRQLYR